MKKKNNRRKKVAGAIIVFVFVLGLAALGRTFFEKTGMVAGEEDQTGSVNFEELKNKIGPNAQYSVNKNTGAVSFLSASKGEIPLLFKKILSTDPTVAAKYFMQEYGKYFGLNQPAKELLFVSKKSDEKEMSHVVYNQKYEGVPVFGAESVVHLGSDNSVSSASANFLPGIISETKPKISTKRAKREGEKYWLDLGGEENPRISKPKLYIFNRGLIENKKSDTSYLVWMVEIFGKNQGGHEYFFINAVDGSFVYHMPGTRNLNRQIFDGNSGSYVLARSEGQGATGITDVDNIYDILDSEILYFSTKFGRNGANKQGGLGDGTYIPYADSDAYVRIDNIETGCPNAYFDGYSINFCNGEAVTDIAGHEYQHGVSYHSVLGAYGQPWGLDYTGESGAIEEAYAGIFGETFEQFRNGSTDWQSGAESVIPGYESVSFSLSNPSSIDAGYGPYPAKTSDSGFYCGTEDNSGVHQNSSPLAHAAYLTAVGGDFNGRSISSIGIDAMEQVYYRAMNYYFTTTTDFGAAYNSLNTSCNDLFGEGSLNCVEIKESFQAVELDQPTRCEAGGTSESPTVDDADIVSDVTSFTYNNKKKTKQRINLTMDDIGVSKKKWVTVRIGGKKMKMRSVRTSGADTIVNIEFKYGKKARGSYGAVVSYKRKVGKSWQRGVVSEDNVLSII